MSLNVNSSNSGIVWPLISVGVMGVAGYYGMQWAKRLNTTEHRSLVLLDRTTHADGTVTHKPPILTVTKSTTIDPRVANTIGAVAGAIWGAVMVYCVRESIAQISR